MIKKSRKSQVLFLVWCFQCFCCWCHWYLPSMKHSSRSSKWILRSLTWLSEVKLFTDLFSRMDKAPIQLVHNFRKRTNIQRHKVSNRLSRMPETLWGQSRMQSNWILDDIQLRMFRLHRYIENNALHKWERSGLSCTCLGTK